MKIDADVLSVLDLSKYFFVVPDYQREYVWEADKHIYQFLVDIDDEFEAHSNEQQSYFIGSIIIIENNGKYDVIDGQQRLTTIVLSLCAMRDLLETLKSSGQLTNESNEILNLITSWIYKYDLKSKVALPRLELQYDESNGYLDTIIKKEKYDGDTTSSIKKMEKAYKRIYEHLQNLINQNIEVFEEYVQYFLTNVNIVVIESDNLGSALKIFETINQRGAGLNAMDLVKNLMFSKASPSQFITIKTKWKEIMGYLEECDEGDNPLRFLRYFLVARYHNGIIREDDLYSWIISKEGKNRLDYEANPLGLVTEMTKSARRYSFLVQATNNDKASQGQAKFPAMVNIGYINKQRSRQHLIVLLALDLSCDDEVLNYLGKQLESFFFFANTIKMQTKNYERRLTDWAVKLRGQSELNVIKDLVYSEVAPFIRKFLGEFKNSFLKINHNSYNPQYRERYILGRLNAQLCFKAGLKPLNNEDVQNLQIEHILPQTPSNQDASIDFSDNEVFEEYVYRLGNTTLLESQINQAINSFNDMASDWFQLKQKQYLNSNCVMTKLLSNEYVIGKDTGLNRYRNESGYYFEEWGIDSIEKRQNILMDLALDHWRFNDKRLDEYDVL